MGDVVGRLVGQDCALCASRTGGSLVCDACAASLPRPSGGAREARLDAATATFEYRFPVDRMVVRFKHGGDLALGAWLARALAERCALEPRPDLLVSPPLSARRLRERGFDQGAQLARTVAGALGLIYAPSVVRRIRDTPAQQGLAARERRANLRGAFRCVARLQGAHVAIVDDVVTTGATARAMARVLRKAGATRIVLWAVARTPAP